MFTILFLLYAVIGLIVNVNLAYALATGKRPWKLSQMFNRPYQNSRMRVGKWHYAAAFISYLVANVILIATHSDGDELAGSLLSYYAITSAVLWFFLEAQYKRTLRPSAVLSINPVNADFDADVLGGVKLPPELK